MVLSGAVELVHRIGRVSDLVLAELLMVRAAPARGRPVARRPGSRRACSRASWRPGAGAAACRSRPATERRASRDRLQLVAIAPPARSTSRRSSFSCCDRRDVDLLARILSWIEVDVASSPRDDVVEPGQPILEHLGVERSRGANSRRRTRRCRGPCRPWLRYSRVLRATSSSSVSSIPPSPMALRFFSGCVEIVPTSPKVPPCCSCSRRPWTGPRPRSSSSLCRLRDVHDRVHVGDAAAPVHRHDRLGLRRDLFLDLGGIDVLVVTHVGIDRRRADMRDRARSRRRMRSAW